MGTNQEVKDSIFAVLNAINVNDHTEKKSTGGKELTYLSWAWAWAEVKKRFPDATYVIHRNEAGLPFVEDAELGLMCFTSVTIQGQTYDMWLPVMDGANKAMRRSAYTYDVYNRSTKQYERKTVAAATMFDVNKTLMRCLVKNLAMHGLGLYIYAGEDLPDGEADRLMEELGQAIDEAQKAADLTQLEAVYRKYQTRYGSDNSFLSAVNLRKRQLI